MSIQEYTTADVFPARLKWSEMFNAEVPSINKHARNVNALQMQRAMHSSKARALLVLSQSLIGLGRNSEADEAVSDIARNFKSTPSYYKALFTQGVLKTMTGNRGTCHYQEIACRR